MNKALSGGDPDNPFLDGTSWGRKLGELGKSGKQTGPSKQANRSELVLNPASSQAYMARERGVRVPKNGTVNEYKKHGCRCEPCRAVASENARRVRKNQQAGQIADTKRHGTLTGYTEDRCRCLECRAVMTNYCREYRAQKREAS